MTPNEKNKDDTIEETKHDKVFSDTVTFGDFKLVDMNLFVVIYMHTAAIYGLYLWFTSVKWTTALFNFFVFIGADIGATAGAHRLWSHKSYKAKLPLQIILMLLQSLANQYTVHFWVRNHRLHHKHSDTDADPHNASKGFFFSHIGWMMTRKNNEVIKQHKFVDISDIENNPVLMFQKKYAIYVIGLACFGLPTLIPVYCWGETIKNAWYMNMLRYVLNLHAIFLINSAAHMWGYKPYDKTISPSQNIFVSLVTMGEGFHNYHHVFPWDYRAGERGNNILNLSTKFIDFFAWIGWAYELKTVRPDMITARSRRTGDGTNLWGWPDMNLHQDDKDCSKPLYDENMNINFDYTKVIDL